MGIVAKHSDVDKTRVRGISCVVADAVNARIGAVHYQGSRVGEVRARGRQRSETGIIAQVQTTQCRPARPGLLDGGEILVGASCREGHSGVNSVVPAGKGWCGFRSSLAVGFSV